MTTNYDEIREENLVRYGTDIERIGPILLHDKYSDRTQFIFELIQNAEDALSRRGEWRGSRALSFDLRSDSLKVSHFGIPFDERDVRGICGIALSSKTVNSIGRFGIGFKSVYAYTDCPQVHSGSESFTINSYVLPAAAPPIPRMEEQTVFIIPFRPQDDSCKEEIISGLTRIGAGSLLFLREIEEIQLSVDGTAIGHYLRQTCKQNSTVRKVTVLGESEDVIRVDVQEWLIFSRSVFTNTGEEAGKVEVAWQMRLDEDGRSVIHRVDHSPLAAYFPTIVETHLGFLLQGPYRTTPSRDNVPPNDEWNLYCVRETGELLQESLEYLREAELLNASGLSCLPLYRKRFEGTMFDKLFCATKNALANNMLLPTHGGGYARASDSIIARSQGLRELLSPQQMAALNGKDRPLMCLDATISQDRTPELREFLRSEFDVQEFTPSMLVNRLTSDFLEQQDDKWIEQLYVFLGSQRGLIASLTSKPIVRLEDGSHVLPLENGTPQAFLPAGVATDFPVVRHSVCQDEAAIKFLISLGLREPNPIDDVLQHVLSKYQDGTRSYSETEYASDVGRILVANESDSREQRQELLQQLRQTQWVRAEETRDQRSVWKTPEEVYLPTTRLKELFSGVRGVYFVDSSVTCLHGTRIRELLDSSGVARVLRTVSVKCDLTSSELQSIRKENGLEVATSQRVDDKAIQGLTDLLDELEALHPEKREQRSVTLWNELKALYRQRGIGAFDANYRWSYSHQSKQVQIDPKFVRQLNNTAWVADRSGHLCNPRTVDFEETSLERDSFLESKISFKPPVMDQLAEEAGIEPGVLELLLNLGLNNTSELRRRLGEPEETQNTRIHVSSTERSKSIGQSLEVKETISIADKSRAESSHSNVKDSGRRDETRKQFISYVGVHSENLESDPEGLTQMERMDLESAAIRFIRSLEPEWKSTPPNNTGFDLYCGITQENAIRWCEVKAMRATMDEHPVGISQSQFRWAQEHGEAYWLYVVEQAASDTPNIVRIQNPVGKAETFTFDRGWREIAVAT